MPQITVPLTPEVALDRIAVYAETAGDGRLPQSLRENGATGLILTDRTENALTVRFRLAGNRKLFYSFLVGVAPVAAGTLVTADYRGRIAPKLAAGLMFVLLSLQCVYELIAGTFSMFNIGLLIVLPMLMAAWASYEKRFVAKKYGAAVMDLLNLALVVQ